MNITFKRNLGNILQTTSKPKFISILKEMTMSSLVTILLNLLILMLMLKVRCFVVTNQSSHRFHDDILCRLFFLLIANKVSKESIIVTPLHRLQFVESSCMCFVLRSRILRHLHNSLLYLSNSSSLLFSKLSFC